MIEEHYESADIPTEELAQYMYENKRLKDELTSLRRNSFGIEENLNMLSVDIQKKDSSLKRSEQQLMSMVQAIQEKDHLIGVMDRKLDQMMDENKNLATSLTLLKDEKDRLNEENEVLREKERELSEKQSEIEMTTYDLKAKIECLSKENEASAALLNELHQQVKILEEEKISLQERIEVLKETRDNRSPSRISPSSFFGGYSFNFSPMRRCLDFSPEKVGNTHVLDDEVIQLNLREELLLAEINEKQNKINSLEEKLQSSENTLHQMSVLIRERLKDAIDVIIDSWNNANEDFEIIFPPLKPYFEKLMDTLGNWSDGQSGENNPLTEAPDSVKVKESVINAQPVPNRTVESISIATQTDRILLAKALEEFSPIQNVLDHKYSDVDMDLYRMSSQNNSPKEDQDLHKSSEDCTTSTSSIDNSNIEHQTIRGNEIPKETENESSQNHVNEDHEQLVAVQSEAEVETPVVDHLNEDIYNIDAALDIDGNTTLSEEEVEKKFQELRLAFRTDAMTLPKRLIIRKRLRDQAELNVEKEINLMKSQLNNLRYLCFDSESLEQLSDLKKHLDVLLASANYLSGSAEAFGFVQNEEKMSGAVAIILRQIESIERIQSELSKSPDLDKSDGKRIQLLPILDDERQEDRVVRRRSVAALALNGPAKRRASIASVPRNPLPTDDVNGSQYSSSPSIFSSRATATVTKKVSPSQSSTPKSISPLVAGDQMHGRLRKESRMGDYGMKFVQDYDNGLGMDDQSDDLLLSSDEEASIEDKGNSQLAVLRMSASLDNRIRKNSVASETLNIIDSLRNVVKWNVILIRNSRFQFPENVHQYVPFLITWYVVVLIVAVFTSGFFTGFNRCFSSQTLYSYSLVSCIVTFWITVLNVVLRWKPTKYLMVTAVLMCAHNLHHTLHDGGIDGVFKRLGIQIEMHYTQGAPI